MFHVKHAIASVAKICLHIFMTEHEHVGHEVSKHNQEYQAKTNIFVYISEQIKVGLEESQHVSRESQNPIIY